MDACVSTSPDPCLPSQAVDKLGGRSPIPPSRVGLPTILSIASRAYLFMAIETGIVTEPPAGVGRNYYDWREQGAASRVSGIETALAYSVVSAQHLDSGEASEW